MSFNLRLPVDLDLMARAQSESLGISLNALICVALAKYLKVSVDVPMASRRPSAAVVPGTSAVRHKRALVALKTAPGQKPSKAARREITANARLARKS